MTTAIVSDLHLGAGNDSDLLRRREALDPLLEAVAGAERLVLLGDVIELRDRPLAEAIELAAPGPARARRGDAASWSWSPATTTTAWSAAGSSSARWPASGRCASPIACRLDIWPASVLREQLGGGSLRISYPGVWVRDDVYATHGHYLDRHLTIPTFERLGWRWSSARSG